MNPELHWYDINAKQKNRLRTETVTAIQKVLVSKREADRHWQSVCSLEGGEMVSVLGAAQVLTAEASRWEKPSHSALENQATRI